MVSAYMRASELLVIILMIICILLAVIIIPYTINEYQIPIFLRSTYSNVFLDFLKLRIVAFAYFIILSGCLPHFLFYEVDTDKKCLHTKQEKIDLFWTDQI